MADAFAARNALRSVPVLAIVVAAVAVALAFAAGPHGDFPVNDDWAYAHSVRWLVAEHRIRLSDWIAMNLLPQTLAGGLVTAIFGFSFTLLRHLTQVVSAVVAMLSLQWFTTTGLRRSDALIATLTLVAAPCWLPLADSYMTDLYGMLFAIPAATLFLRALRVPRVTTVGWATALAAAGVLQRQVVVVVPIAFAIAWIASALLPDGARLASTRRSTVRIVIGLVPTLVVVAIGFAYYAYLVNGPGVPTAQRLLQGRVLPAIVKTIENDGGFYRYWAVSNLFAIVAYLGLFAAPFALWRGWPAPRWTREGMLGIAAIAVLIMGGTGLWPPWRADQLVDAAGIGPFTLYDAQPRGLATIDRGAGAFWVAAGAAAAFGIAALCRTGLVVARGIVARGNDAPERIFLVTLIVGYVAPFVVTDFIDRYLLFVLPFVLALIGIAEPVAGKPLRRALAVLVLAIALVVEVMAVHDYFAWNRARWDAIEEAQRRGATPATLDGGFEYNGYFGFETRPRTRRPGKSWWWVDDDRFVVSFGPVAGYVERARYSVRRWLPRTPSQVLLLERR